MGSYSVVVGGFIESDVVFRVDNEVTRIDIITFKHHFEYFWLVHCSLLHEVDNFILNHDCMIDVIIQLHLHFILKLTILLQEVFIINWICEIFIILGQEVEFANVSPRVESISHGVLCQEPHVFASSEQV